MIKMKVGGMILTGCAAFLMVSKVVNSFDATVNKVCETAKWRGYYRCWSKGKADGEPMAPGYSRTTRPDGANFEVVDDPTGKDHQKDNEPDIPKNGSQNSDAAKAVVEAVKDIAEKVVDNLTKPSGEPREASEDQTEASTDENIGDLENIIECAFEGDTDADAEFQESIEGAREAGVPEEKILHDVNEIDDLFTK